MPFALETAFWGTGELTQGARVVQLENAVDYWFTVTTFLQRTKIGNSVLKELWKRCSFIW